MKAIMKMLIATVVLCHFSVLKTYCEIVAVSDPPNMVEKSNIIVEGVLSIKGDYVSIYVKAVLKGNAAAEGKNMQIQSQYKPMGFNLAEEIKAADGGNCIVLGNTDGDGIISLPWLHFSVWPFEIRYQLLQYSFEACESYIQTILNYEKTALNISETAVVSLLLQDMKLPDHRIAVLGFLNAFLDERIEREQSRSALYYYMIMVLLNEGEVEVSIVENVERLFPCLPKSLVLRYFSMVLDHQTYESSSILSSATCVLRHPEMYTEKATLSITELRAEMKKYMGRLQLFDAEKALSFFDSDIPAIRQNAPEILSLILQDEGNKHFSDQETCKKSYWVEKISIKKAELDKLK